MIFTLKSIFCFIKTNIPELYKPWTSTSSNHSTLIGAPLFIVISRHGVVFIITAHAERLEEKKKQLSLAKKLENILPEFESVNIKNYMLNTEIAKL